VRRKLLLCGVHGFAELGVEVEEAVDEGGDERDCKGERKVVAPGSHSFLNCVQV